MKSLFNSNRKKKQLPTYWLDYLNGFNSNSKNTIETSRFIVLDTETTGFDIHNDKVLCIGAITIENLEIKVATAFEIYIKQEHFNEDAVEIHGIIKNERVETLTEEEALKQFLAYIGNAVLVAHHASFDINMINQMLKREGLPKLKNKVLDTVNLYKASRTKSHLMFQNNDCSLDKIADNFALDVTDRHTAAGDALITALIFLKTTHSLMSKKGMSLRNLFKL